MKINLVGQKFGKLTVVSYSRNDPKIGTLWNCACDCGETVEKRTGALRDKHNKCPSCGCGKIGSIKFAAQKAKEANTFYHHPDKNKIKDVRSNMLKRCYDVNCRSYKTYGARGITVCDEWRTNPKSFYDWALSNGWHKGLTIERKNVNLGYSPENCCFITPKEQQQNTTRSRFVEWNGEKKTVSQWAEQIGVAYRALQHRLDRGWTLERVFNQPYRGRTT